MSVCMERRIRPIESLENVGMRKRDGVERKGKVEWAEPFDRDVRFGAGRRSKRKKGNKKDAGPISSKARAAPLRPASHFSQQWWRSHS